MDPDGNILEQLRLAQRLTRIIDKGEVLDVDDVARLAELVIDLDEWLCKRGYLPCRWSGD